MNKNFSKTAMEQLSCSTTPLHAALLQKARYLQAVESKIHPLIPSPLNQHCRVANVRDGILILQTDSAVWATKARFATAELLPKILSLDLGIEQIRIGTRPSESVMQTATRRASLSSTTAELVNDLADSITNPPLAAALRRLARHAKQ